MAENFIDRTIEVWAPGWALKRKHARARLDSVRRFDAASQSRHTKGWNPSPLSTNADIQNAIVTLRTRSRDLARNNEYFKNILRIVPNSVVGTGIIPSIKTDALNNKKVKQAEENLKKVWRIWSSSLAADFDGNLSLYGLQHLAMKSVQKSGEIFAVKIRGNSKMAIPLQIQLLEPEFLDTSKHSQRQDNDGSFLFYGIKFDKKGRRLGYWIYDRHPNEFAATSRMIPAQDVIHLFEVEDAGQQRGIPFGHASMLRMNDVNDYEFAERVRNKIAASFAAFVTSDEGGDTKSDGTNIYDNLEPGSINYMKPGEQVTFSTPPTNNTYAEFVKQNLRAIAAGNGVTYESMTNDLSNVNFSSGRMGWIEMSRNIQHWQWNLMIPKFCVTVWDWFIEAAVLKGIIPENADVQVTWTPPRREMIDPYKEGEAIKEMVRSGLTSLPEAIKEQGYDPDEIFEEIAATNKKLDDFKIQLTSDPRQDAARLEKVNPSAIKQDNSKTGPDIIRD